MGAKKRKSDHGVIRSTAHRRMLSEDYAKQRLSTFTAGRKQSKPLDHHLIGADKLDSDQGIKKFLAMSRSVMTYTAERPEVATEEDGKSDHAESEGQADEDESQGLLDDEDVIHEFHHGQLYTEADYA